MANFRRQARQAARRYGLDPNVFEAQINQESGFNPDVIFGRRSSSAGAQGIAQIIPSTARSWGVDPLKPSQALDAAAKHMAEYVKQFGNYADALRAYNAGPGNVKASHGFSETNNYVSSILGGRNPSSGGVRPGGGGGGGRVGPVTVGASAQRQVTLPAGDSSQVLAQLGAELSRPAPPVIGLQAPSFAAGATLPTGQRAVVGQGTAPVAAPDYGRLAASIVADQSQAQPSTLTVGGRGQATAQGVGPDGGGGRLFYVGDSLGVGTSPDVSVTGRNVKVGRSSAESLAILKQKVAGGFRGRVVFDAGTNDSSARELRQSLRQAKQLGVPLYVPTITGGPDAAAKNRVIRELAGGNLHVVDTSSLAPDAGDSIHYSASGYQKRARLVQQAVGTVARTGTGPSQRALQQAKGLQTFDGYKVASWIAPVLQAARQAGVKFTLSSGWRSDAEQKAIYDSGVRPAATPRAYGGGGSNHEFKAFPGGAVDVSNRDGGAERLAAWLAQSKYRNLLVYAGSKDPVHFSHPHNGSY